MSILKERDGYMYCPNCGNKFSKDPKASKYCGYCRLKTKLKLKELENR